MLRRHIAFAASVILVAIGTGSVAQAAGRGKGVAFPVSCNAQSQQEFNDALAALHSFWYAQAAKEFQAIAEREPDCAMAHWGYAMSRWTQLWAPPRQDALDAGLAALRKAAAAPKKTQREADYIAAATAFFGDNDKVDHRTRVKAYAAAMEKVSKTYDSDREAALFYALALLATADPLDSTYATQKRAGEIIEAVFKQLPEHPGPAHYLIHAYDCGPLADKALAAAEAYAKTAEVVPHAIHMPSHTYVLLGRWRANIASNLVGEKAEAERGIPEDRLHDIDYLVYGYLQIGEPDNARKFRDLAQSIEKDLVAAKRDVGLRARPFTLAAVDARYALERSDWTEAATVQLRPSPIAFIEAIPHFARAVGAARSGKPGDAKPDLARLAELQAALVKAKQPYWAHVVEIQEKIAAAWVADAEGRPADALALMQTAADLEKGIDTHDTLSPGPIGATAHESLGELQLKSGNARAALAAFEQSLKIAKHRARGLVGAAKAAQQTGDAQRHKTYVAELADICGTAGATMPTKDAQDARISGLPCAALAR
ncbi:MAG: hypothetical protein C5B56_05185 [Proteobacteria bacterium]|nr:MAG: hypothetical protein C5B56_05185 [Pseudomonadota bacterium]